MAADQAARAGSGVLIVLAGHNAIDHRRQVAAGGLQQARAAGRQVVVQGQFAQLQVIEVDDVQVRPHAWRDQAAVGEAEQLGVAAGLAVDDMGQRQGRAAAPVAGPIGQLVGGADRIEDQADVGPAIGKASDGGLVQLHLAHRVQAVLGVAGGSPRRFYSMSARIREERRAYYDILEATQKGDLDITRWLEWFLSCLDHALVGADVILANVLKKARFWQVHAGEPFSERQRLMLNRLLDGFEGKLTSSKWATITKISQDTASRDIDDLLRRRILFKEPGGGRSVSYILVVTAADPIRAIATYTRMYSTMSVWTGAKLASAEERVERRRKIEDVADKFDALAERSLREQVSYEAFEALREELRQYGFFPEGDLVSAVAFAIQRDQEAGPLFGGS